MGIPTPFHILGRNGPRHVAPPSAGDTIYAWSEVLDNAELPGRSDMAALRLRTFAVKDRACADFPGLKADGSHEDGVVLDMDYWVALPRQGEAAGAEDKPSPAAKASAVLKDANGKEVGRATFTATPSGALLSLSLTAAPPGVHALHVQAIGKCVPP